MDIQTKIVTPFNRSLGNGAQMGVLFALAIDHVIENRDTTVIVKLINSAKNNIYTHIYIKYRISR